mmetsp:Transcript_16893/g.48160  ORF Transcript_16893/g.48160 Transcript_16893/m.48160 type:complete len:298 (-) Transcript_16893:73-966(-)
MWSPSSCRIRNWPFRTYTFSRMQVVVSFVLGSTEAHCLRDVAGQSFLRGGLRADLSAAPAMANARAAPAPLPSTSPRSIAKAAAIAVSTRFVESSCRRRSCAWGQAPAQGGRAPATLRTSRSLAANAFSHGATPAPGADIRAHSRAAKLSTSSSPSKYKAPKLCRQPLAVLMEMSWRWQCSLVTSKSMRYGATSLSPSVNLYRPRNASTMAASFSCRSQSSASFCVARTNESPAGTLSVSTELSCAWRSHQALMGVRAASSSPRRGMAPGVAAAPNRRQMPGLASAGQPVALLIFRV